MAGNGKNGTIVPVERPAMSLFDQMEREFEEMHRRMGALFHRPFGAPRQVITSEFTWAPTADAYEQDGNLIVKAELPGVKQDDIQVSVQDGILTVAGERKEEKETKEARYYASERFAGSFSRSFALPDGVDSKAITSQYKDGVLTVTVPMPVKATAEPVKIPVKA